MCTSADFLEARKMIAKNSVVIHYNKNVKFC